VYLIDRWKPFLTDYKKLAAMKPSSYLGVKVDGGASDATSQLTQIVRRRKMKKILAFTLILALTLAFTYSMAFAGNGAPNGAHYNLNIIGVKDKTAEMTGAHGHVIFVKLYGNTKIWLCESGEGEEGDECADVDGFRVLDKNGTDKDGALFALPNPDPDGDGVTVYSVYARALGKPGGSSTTTTCATDPVDGEEVCSVYTLVLKRDKGQSKFTNVSKELLYIYVDLDGDGDTERYPLFDDRLEDYFWSYDNNGLKLLQLRFYEVPTDVN
jgi:hypothetical protein